MSNPSLSSIRQATLTKAKTIVQANPGCNLIIFGRPGAGKGTLAQALELLGYCHIGVGKLLCGITGQDDPSSQKVLTEMGDALILPDHLAKQILQPAMDQARGNGKLFVLDGYPATSGQLKDLADYQAKHELPFVLIHLDVTREEASQRLLHRKTCPQCHISYPKNIPVCEICLIPTQQRYDDTNEFIQQRQDLFDQVTAPIYQDVITLCESNI